MKFLIFVSNHKHKIVPDFDFSFDKYPRLKGNIDELAL